MEIQRKKEVILRDSEERQERDVAKEVVREQIRSEERAREDPHEGEILEQAAKARQRDREVVRDIEMQSAARISRTVPKKSNEDASVSSFVREQQRKNEEIERLRKLDEQSLRSLNSPLPSPGKAPVSMPPSPAVPVARSSPTSMPDLSLASLTMAKKKNEESPAVAPATTSPPPSPPRLNLFEMTKLKKDTDSSSSTPTVSRPNVNKRPVKRAVRQQLPLSTRSVLGDDDEDDDDDDLMRSGAPGLTVADALKQQRKKKGGNAPGGKDDKSAEQKAMQWGIDMSKFK